MKEFDLVVIGGGPGGYSAALRAAKNGMKTLVIDERERPGGTCLHVGCIPSKALLFSTEMAHFFTHDGSLVGIGAERIDLDYGVMQRRSREVVRQLTEALFGLFQQTKVEYWQGRGEFSAPKIVTVNGEEVTARHIILATGSTPIELPFLPFDEKMILSSTGALQLEAAPRSLIVVGGGIIGLEMASIFARMGTEVTVIELLEEVAAGVDHEMARSLRASLTKLGIIFHLSTKVVAAEIEEGQVRLKTSGGSFSAEKVLVSVGRKPNTANLGLDNTAVQKDERGFIQINSRFATTQPGIYAIGDLVNGPMLAHKAEEEGAVLADLLLGKEATCDLFSVPSVIYTFPEVASVGFTEKEAKALGRDLIIAKFPIRALGRAKAMGIEEGLVKIIGDKKSRKLLGLHLFSPSASEMIHVGTLALRKRLTIDDLQECSFAHPTLSEGIKEALRLL